MTAPHGFDWTRRAGGDVVIRHHGREVTLVRGAAAEKLAHRLERADGEQAQHLLARATGNYRRGNERRSG